MANFSDDEVIRGSELRSDPVLADVKFLRRDYARLVETTEEQSEQIVSMTTMLRELQQTLSQLSNQLGIRPIDAESSPQALPFEATPENSSANVAAILEAGASSQVPVPSLEPGLSFSSETFYVSEAWQSDMVSNNRLHLQSGFECVMNKNNAHHVFDELFLRRHKFQQGKQLSLSPKSRMFKFKNKTLLSNWSQMDLPLVIDISNVTNSYPCFSADFGLVRKKRTFQCLRLRNLGLTKQSHKSRYHLRMLHDPGGEDDEHSVDITYSQLSDEHKASACAVVKYSETATYTPAMQTEGCDEACAAARDALERTGTWIVTSLPANNIEEALLKVVTKPVTEGTTTGFKEVFMTLAAPVSQLNCFNLPLHHVPNNGLLVFPWHLLFLEFFLSIHLEDKVCLSGASNSWCGWMVFDRGKNIIISEDVITLKRDGQKMLLVKVKDAHVDSLVVSFKELWIEIMDGDIAKLLNSTSGRLQSYGYVRVVMFLRRLRVHHRQQKRKFTKAWKFKYKSRFQEISLTDTQFLCEKVQRVSCLSLAAQFNSLAIIQAVLEQIIQGETSTKIIDNAASSSGSHAKSLLIAMGFCPTLVQKAIGENGEDLELLLEILTKSTVTEEPSFRGLMEPKLEPDIESATDIRRMTLLTLQFPENLVDLALDRLGKGMPNWERMSIWHRWRRKD